MNFLRSSSLNGRLRPNVARPRFSSTSHSHSLMLVPPEIEVTSSGFRRSMWGLMGGWSRQLRSTATASPKTVFRNFLPRFFSGAARDPDRHLRRSINREYLRSVITSEEGDEIPVESRFQLEDVAVSSNGRGKRITFMKMYNGERTFVQVFVVEENSAWSCDLMYVVSKKPDRQLVFMIHPPFDTEIRIGNLILYPSQDDMRQLTTVEAVQDATDTYEFSELDEDLQAGLYKYLAVRGVSADWWRKVAPSCLTMQSTPVPNSPPPASIATPDIFRSIIDSEPPVVFGIPVGSPFAIFRKSTITKGAVIYHYQHNGEVVFVYVRPKIEKNNENSGNSKTAFGVSVLKQQDRIVLVFDITALDGEIRIHSLGFGDLNCYDDPLDCKPIPYKFNDLDEDLQAAFYKYLAVRGITADWYVENEVLYFR